MTPSSIAPQFDRDTEVLSLLEEEEARQAAQITLVASENYSSPAVRSFEGSLFADKNAEGYPGKRYVSGCEVVDRLECLAIERAKALFGCDHANVQAMSATIANYAVMKELLAPQNTVLAMRLQDGGHFSHGATFHASGRDFRWQFYGVSKETEQIDYDAVRILACESRPAVILCGGSSYPRLVDYRAMGVIAREVGAILWVDLSHTAGLVAGGAAPSPFPDADIVTTSTHKTLRGPRGGGLVLGKAAFAKRIDRALFPGLQGAPKMDMIAARAALLREVRGPAFKCYAQAVIDNARALADGVREAGVRLVTGGTSSHLVLVDVAESGRTGREIEELLLTAGVVSNRNAIPFDRTPTAEGGGLRIGSAAMTTRGLDHSLFCELGRLIGAVIREPGRSQASIGRMRSFVREIGPSLPLFHDRWLSDMPKQSSVG